MDEFVPIENEIEEEVETYDLFTLLPKKKINCLDKGFVKIIDSMPRIVPVSQKADSAIVQAARVSYGKGTKKLSEDRGLIRYLMRHVHTTPTEMVELKFHCKMPIFVARQWIRTRTASVNEISGRYSILKDDFYIPVKKDVSLQSKNNKQGGDETAGAETAEEFIEYLDGLCNSSYSEYENLINNKNISREQARMILPVNLYTEWYWKIDLHNLFRFLSLRCDSHAQYEIRVFAEAMLELIQPLVPFSIEAWEDYDPKRGGMLLTRPEIDSIKKAMAGIGFNLSEVNLDSDNKRENMEWKEKAKRLL